MATYKLIQDIEADDKLLGPLSFRQFIYALIGAAFLYLSYLFYAHHASLLDIASLPVVFIAAFFAFPFGKDQPTEVWALAKLRFMLKPRRRIWAQSGVKELVTITVPKKIEIQRTDGLSQTEVKSRLTALANTIDSRGWAIKNVSSVYQNPLTASEDSDRLISAATLPQAVNDDGIPDSEDPLDSSNPINQQMNQLLSANTSQHRQKLMDNLNDVRKKRQKPVEPTVTGDVPPPPKPETPALPDNQLVDQLKAAYATTHSSLNNMHNLRSRRRAHRALANEVAVKSKAGAEHAKNKATDPVIMNLAQRNDLNVNVIANEVNKAKNPTGGNDEVLISLR